MSGHDWVSVGHYSDPMSASVVSKLLSDEGVPNRIWTPPRSPGESYIWVPPESADTAKRILAEPAVSEAELTALALRDPPPDDFETSETEQRRAFSEPPASHALFFLIPFLGIALLAALALDHPKIQSHEIARQPSPDGRAEAVLIEIPRDAGGAHSYKVCLQRANGLPLALSDCGEIAYLAGVSTDSVSQPVTLVWTASSQLEIHYVKATSVHVYKSAVVLGSRRYPIDTPIFIRTVQGGPVPAR
jgi:hypothetical protein